MLTSFGEVTGEWQKEDTHECNCKTKKKQHECHNCGKSICKNCVRKAWDWTVCVECFSELTTKER
jgi:hypothetical protein